MSYPLDYSITELNILAPNGTKFDFKKFMINLSYYEDLFGFCSSGSLLVNDSMGYIETLQLSGNEFIEIEVGKVAGAPNNIKETFRLYKINKRKPTGNMMTEQYEFLFCSEELILSEQIKISQSYPDKKVSEIVQDILENKLKVNKNKISTIEETLGVYDLIVPVMRPLEAISWVSTYGRPKNYPGADMIFYQDRVGFNFRSLQSLYKEPVYGTYKYSMKNLDDENQSTEEKQRSVLKYEILKTYDSLAETKTGAMSSKLISVDPLTRSFNITNFDYSKYQQNNNSAQLEKNSPTSFLTNRLGQTQNQAFDAVLKMTPSTSNHANVDYIKNKPGSVVKDLAYENNIPLRTAQLSLATFRRVKITIPGDTGITVGKIIEFNIASLDNTQKNKELDKFYSGKYLVTALRHVFTTNQFQTLLEISKDSSSTKLETPNEQEFMGV